MVLLMPEGHWSLISGQACPVKCEAYLTGVGRILVCVRLCVSVALYTLKNRIAKYQSLFVSGLSGLGVMSLPLLADWSLSVSSRPASLELAIAGRWKLRKKSKLSCKSCWTKKTYWFHILWLNSNVSISPGINKLDSRFRGNDKEYNYLSFLRKQESIVLYLFTIYPNFLRNYEYWNMRSNKSRVYQKLRG